MPLPAGFPDLNSPAAKRRPPPDYTHRSTKLRLFAATAAVMVVLFLIERGPALFISSLKNSGVAVGESHREAVGERSSTTAEARQTPPAHRTAGTGPSELAKILGGYNLGPSELSRFTDGQPLTLAEVEPLARLLDRLPGLRYDLCRARQPPSALQTVVAAPAEHRGEVIEVRGRARRVVKDTLPLELAERFEFRDYYRLVVDMNGLDQSVALYTCRIPTAWPLDQPFDEPIAADALFLKLLKPSADAPAGDESLPAFAAERVAWMPEKLRPDRGIGPAQIALASLGMDIGLWDNVRQSNHRPLEPKDREPFYQLLAAVDESRAATLLAASAVPLAIGDLLQRPQEFQGSPERLTGVARRIQRIDVAERDVQERFGFDHYYEIDVFLPLGDANIRLGQRQPGQQSPEFRNTFPATLVVRQLPPGLSPNDNLHEQISVTAVFFKIWTYDSRYTARFGQLQPAPLFIAAQPRLIQTPVSLNWLTTALISSALGLSLAALMLVLWWSARPPRRPRSTSAPPDFTHVA